MAWTPVPPDPARWQERLAALHTVVAESDGVLAGFASHTHDGYLDFLFTHPDYARSGVASRLYQIVESALRNCGATQVTCHVSLAARLFFDHNGFEVDAEECVECRGSFLRLGRLSASAILLVICRTSPRRVPFAFHSLSLLKINAARNPATVIRPAKSCASANASGIIVSTSIARIAPAAMAVVPAITSSEKRLKIP